MTEENDEINPKRRIWTLTDEELSSKSNNATVKSLHKLIGQSEYFSLKNFISSQGLWDATIEDVKEQLIHSIEND